MHTLQILLQALGVILLADFLAGVIHWLEDAYGTEDTPIIGPLAIRPNIIHHHYPRFFTKLSCRNETTRPFSARVWCDHL